MHIYVQKNDALFFSWRLILSTWYSGVYHMGRKGRTNKKKKRANKKRQMCAHARAHTHTRQRSNSGVDRRNTTCDLWYTRAMDDSLPTADVMYCCSGRTQIVPVLIEKRGIILSAIRDTSKFLPVCPARDGEITEIYTSFGVCG